MRSGDQFCPPTTNAIYRVLKIRGKSIGTGFYVDFAEQNYFVTALHIVEESAPELFVFWGGKWQDFPCRLLATNSRNDIAVLLPSVNYCPPGFPCALDERGAVFGQHAFFLGFPFGDSGSIPSVEERDRPIPFVKWGAISMFPALSEDGHLVLDGINNPGFSGAPVFVNKSDGTQCIIGMITGFKEETGFVEDFSNPESTGLLYKQNTGLILAAGVESITRLLLRAEEEKPKQQE